MAPKKTNKNKKVVLIVEDEESIREALEDKFKLSGFEVITSKNGEEGLSKAKSFHPNLIILDILMPKMDGLTMLRKLKEDSWGTNVPVMILTNISDYRQLEEALSLGVDEYMIKAEWQLKNIVAKANAILGIE
jgi:DNA-binding response OmpR family regulator